MDVCFNFWILLPLILKGFPVDAAKPTCDVSLSVVPNEGAMGESSIFPWLGVLKVHIHEENSLHMAMTGLVLVKDRYAITNADDIARIPKKIFLRDSLAMFIPRDGEEWYCAVQDYMLHPEYNEGVVNTIALLEMTLLDDPVFPVKPICHPKYPFNTSTELYAVGFTDEGKLLEKSIYKIVYVPEGLCAEYYKRAGFASSKTIPRHFHCGFTQSVNKSCIWDNGMALISNVSTGEWRLVGLGVHGPGCAAPARFVDLQHYYPWITASTDPHHEKAHLRTSALNLGFKPRKSDTVDIPVHDLLRHGLRQFKDREPHDDIIPGPMDYSHYYPHLAEPPDQGGESGKLIWPEGISAEGHLPDMKEQEGQAGQGQGLDHFTVHRQEPSVLYVSNDDYSYPWGNCSIRNNFLIYKDYMKIESRTAVEGGGPIRGTAVYKLSMFDLNYLNYSCVKIKLFATRPENAYIYYDVRMETTRRTVIPSHLRSSSYSESHFPDPSEIIKVYPIRPVGGWRKPPEFQKGQNESQTDGANPKPGIRPKPHWKVETITDKIQRYEHPNINIYIKLHFVEDGKLEVRVFGPPRFTFTAPTTNPLRRSITWSTRPKGPDTGNSRLRAGEGSEDASKSLNANLRKDQLFAEAEGSGVRSEIGVVVGVLVLTVALI